jgi:ABC-type branched-subunit amino acid transport system ATPase component/ABC-type branched-subunit amino acid transport system permease subunit
VRQVSLAVWATAGLLAAVAGILLGPAQPVLAGLFGTGGSGAISNDSDLLLRGLGAAMIGGLVSLPQVFAAGIGLGVVEALVQWNYPNGGAVGVVIVALIIGSLMLRRDLRQLTRGGEESSWSLAGAVRPLTSQVRRLPRVRAAHGGALGLALAVAILVPWVAAPSQRILYTAIALFALMAVSLVLLTGWAGQVSLGQFAFVGLGALVGGRMQQLGYPMFGGMVFAVAAVALAALVVGLPALRLRGLFLAVTTLAFAVLLDETLTHQKWLVNAAGNGSLKLDRPNAHGINLNSELTYYYFVLAVTVLIVLAVYYLRRTGVARKFMAVRDNEAMAAAVGVGPASTKLTAFVLSGCVAAVAGYLYGMMLVNTSGAVTDPAFSLTIMTMVIIGGATSLTGAILGALYIRGIPYFVHSTAIQLLTSGGGLLVVILLFPGGLATVAFRTRDWVVARLSWSGGDASDSALSLAPTERRPTPVRAPLLDAAASPALEAISVGKRFGGLVALEDVSLQASAGEIVGILGPNGAGKTTLFDILNGLQTPDCGQVLLHGDDITRLSPQARARLGLGRSFQQARLFEALTVEEVVMTALEREEPTELVPSLFALPPSWAAERRKRERAAAIIERFGLTGHAERPAGELSTGTRRIVELACTAALGADVLLLDEPTGGIAQREVEAFVPVLRDLRGELDATMIVVAHDVPMMVDLVDRLYVLAGGKVIAEGPPHEVTRDPAVIAAYLGDDTAVAADRPRRRRKAAMATVNAS